MYNHYIHLPYKLIFPLTFKSCVQSEFRRAREEFRAAGAHLATRGHQAIQARVVWMGRRGCQDTAGPLATTCTCIIASMGMGTDITTSTELTTGTAATSRR